VPLTTFSKYNLQLATLQMSNTFTQKHRLYTGENLSGFQLISKLGDSIFPDILPWVVFFTSYGFVLSLIDYWWTISVSIPQNNDTLTTALLVFNICLPFLLVFRTNTAHQRFWEGRRLWGELTNVVRNLTRDIWIVVQANSPKKKKEKENILLLVVAFAIGVKLHLRAEKVNDELVSLMSETQYFQLKYYTNHLPLKIAFWIGNYLQSQSNLNYLNVYQLSNLHELVDTLVNILGGCERILKTPQPIIYSLMLRKLILVYCLLMPLEIVGDCHGFTSVIMTFTSTFLLGIDQIGSQLEQPFAINSNALPLDLICNTILLNVKELIEYINEGAKN
jgi:ion channel-forming bestrophin family protein